MTTFFLRHHVFACIEDGYLVFLDVRRDTYLCVDKNVFNGIADTIAGLPRPTKDGVDIGRSAVMGRDTLNSLLYDQVITTSEAEGKRFESQPIVGETRSLLGGDPTSVGSRRLEDAC